MTRDPKTIVEGTTVEDAMAIFSQRKISALFVMDRNDVRRPCGLLHIHDLTRLGVS
jgi:arabinose-5-phosphate isomerase